MRVNNVMILNFGSEGPLVFILRAQIFLKILEHVWESDEITQV